MWTEQTLTPAPSARKWHAMACNANALILFGGLTGAGRDDETWGYASGAWLQESPVHAPSARYGHGMAQSSAGVLLFGGDTGSLDAETWLWDSLDWTQLAPGTSPSARAYHGMCAAPGTDDCAVWGGSSDTSLWTWNGNTWTEHATDVAPSARYAHGMWYDAAADKLFVYGGLDWVTHTPLSDLWAWDGAWIQIPATQARPARRSLGHGVAYDPVVQRSIFATEGLHAAGTIVTVPPIDIIDGETVTISDGTTSLTFEFDTDSSTNPANEPVAIAATSLASDVAEVLTTAINGAAFNIVATQTTPTSNEIQLINTQAGVGVVAITNTVTDQDFVTTGMAFEDLSAWAFRGAQRFFSPQYLTTYPAATEGAAVGYEPTGDELILFGGAVTGALTATQYAWSWEQENLTPYYTLPGSLEGRIEPIQSSPPDGSWVFCLGSDAVNLPDFILDIGDALSVSQAFDILSPQKLLRFKWRARYSPKQAQYRQITAVTTFKAADLIATGDPLKGVLLPTSQFTTDDEEQACKITGATSGNNNGYYHRLTSVPSGLGNVGYFDPSQPPATYAAGRVAALDLGSISAATETATVSLLGVQWRARCILDTGTVQHVAAELVERIVQTNPNGWQRQAMAANVSQFQGSVTLKFELALEAVEA